MPKLEISNHAGTAVCTAEIQAAPENEMRTPRFFGRKNGIPATYVPATYAPQLILSPQLILLPQLILFPSRTSNVWLAISATDNAPATYFRERPVCPSWRYPTMEAQPYVRLRLRGPEADRTRGARYDVKERPRTGNGPDAGVVDRFRKREFRTTLNGPSVPTGRAPCAAAAECKLSRTGASDLGNTAQHTDGLWVWSTFPTTVSGTTSVRSWRPAGKANVPQHHTHGRRQEKKQNLAELGSAEPCTDPVALCKLCASSVGAYFFDCGQKLLRLVHGHCRSMAHAEWTMYAACTERHAPCTVFGRT
eukprot:gene23893-biopygen11868